MPLPGWLLPMGISAGTNILSGLFGGKQQGLSPEQQQLYNRLQGLLSGGMPSWMSSQISVPYIQQGKQMERRFARQAGASGLHSAQMLRQVTNPRAQALGREGARWEMGIMGQLQNLLSGTYQQPTDWGGIAGNIGGDAAFLAGLYKALGMDGQKQGAGLDDLLRSGGGMQYQPGFLGR